MLKLIALIIIMMSIVSAGALWVRSAMVIRDHIPTVLRGENTWRNAVPYYAFDRTVPLSAQRQYLLANALGSVAAMGAAVFVYLSGSYGGAVMFAVISCVGVTVTSMDWMRFRRGFAQTGAVRAAARDPGDDDGCL